MVTYNCYRCGYSSELKGNIRRHFLKKKSCQNLLNSSSVEECFQQQLGESYPKTLKNAGNDPKMTQFTLKNAGNANNVKTPTNTVNKKRMTPPNNDKPPKYECDLCGKTFKQIRYMEDHLRRSCVYIQKSLCKKIQPYLDELNNMRNELNIARIRREKDNEIILELKEQISVLLKGKGNIYNYSQNIIIQPFGKENLSYIKQEYVNDLIKHGPIQCIPKLLKHIHFNSNHLENHNIKIPNKKQSFAQVYNGQQWEYTDKQLTIDNMTGKALDIIHKHYNGSNKYMDDLSSKMIDNNKVIVKKINKDTELMILNYQETINKE